MPAIKRPSYFPFVALALGALAVIISWFEGELFTDPDRARMTWFLSGGLGLAAIFYFTRSLQLDWLSAPVVYACLFWVFHFGLTFPAAIYPGLLDPFPWWERDWLDTAETQQALLLSLLFLFCFLLGSLLPRYRRRLLPPPAASERKDYAGNLIWGGWACVIGGALIGVVAMTAFGLSAFLESYEEFFDISHSFSLAIYLITLGLMLQVAGGRPLGKVGLAIACFYLPIAVLTFMAGSRMAPLFSLGVMGVILTRRGLRLPRLGLIAAVFFLLGLVAVVNETRQTGLSHLHQTTQLASANPLSGLTEVGGSLRSVYALVHEMENFGHGYFYGYTYIYPVVRQVKNLIGSAGYDDYYEVAFIARYIAVHYGAFGFSTVAEAFFNGGVLGVMLFALLWGLILEVLNQRAGTPYGLAILVVVLIPMIVNVRNTFIFVPAWLFIGFALVGVSRYLQLVRRVKL
ncbi:MAG: oligosaccharide repeat unit polymerase [Deltaproteobacteria bacterium]|nr:oligosaccharide repeat unit polymerase [Deltaproteobacteria bacterium]